ncbi:MAG: PKD domain-containing protein [Candidatus Bipolaricaulota bacterium]
MRRFGKYVSLVILFSLLIFSLNGCNSNETPTASFSADPSTGGAPLQVTFDASNSEDPDGIIDEFEWEFGDGNTGNGRVADHTYEDTGEYTITLTVTDNDGSTETTTETVTVEESKPEASLSGDPEEGEAPLTVSFDLTGSEDPDGVIEEYRLDFGDDDSTSGDDLLDQIEHTYEEPGEYTVTLEVVDDDELTDTATTTLEVTEAPEENEPPVAEISASPETGTAPLTVEFSADESSDPDGEIESYEWEFGDGSARRGREVTNEFKQGGDYTVTLTVIDDRDGSDTAETTISVDPATYYVGESADNGSIRLTLQEVNTRETIGDWEAEAGKHFVVATVSVRALEDGQYPSKSLNFSLEESSGRTQAASLATSLLEEYFQSDVLDEDEVASGKIAFEARKSSDYYRLIYEAPNQGPIQFEIENENS